MWSFRLFPRGLPAVAAPALLTAAMLLAACGFQPLYGSAPESAVSPSEHLAAVRIAPLSDRIGQQLHNLLRDRLNPQGQPGNPAYELRIDLRESRRELSIRKDETASRANLIVAVRFTLHDVRSDRVLLQASATSTNSYNILTNSFATTYSEQNARRRGLREVSDDIRTRLAIYFASAADAPS